MAMNVKDQILLAGVGLLHEEGLSALTQPRIAKAAGVSQSHLTYYFPTRADLLVALAEHSVDQALGAAIEHPGSPQEALLLGIRYLPRVRMLVGLVSAADRDPNLRPALERLIAHIRSSLKATLTALGFAPTAAQVTALHGMMVGFAVLNLGRQSKTALREIETAVSSLLETMANTARTRRKEK
jgi:AcrR family transcriptional regulator